MVKAVHGRPFLSPIVDSTTKPCTIILNKSSDRLVVPCQSTLPIVQEPISPFLDDEFCVTSFSIVKPVEPLLKTSNLKDLNVNMPNGNIFVDKVLPDLELPRGRVEVGRRITCKQE